MTPEHIHDALTLLPGDLIAETDRKRTRKPKRIPWGRFAAMAACFLLVLGCSHYAMLMGSRNFAKTESAAEAPMMQEAPAAADEYFREETWAPGAMESPAEEAAPRDTAPAMEEPVCSVPLAPEEGKGEATAGATSNAGLCIDHVHHPAEAFEDSESVGGWCGNMTATISIGELTYSISGTDAVTITDILYNLRYDLAGHCRCAAEFTVDTEVGTGYEVSLTDYFVRREGAQAALTPEQAKAIREALPMLYADSFVTRQTGTPQMQKAPFCPEVTLITSREELEDYWREFGDCYGFVNMKAACAGYDDRWFADCDLLLNVVQGRADDTLWEVAAIGKGGGNGWDYSVFLRQQGQVGPNGAAATFHLLTELEKGVLTPGKNILQVYMSAENP